MSGMSCTQGIPAGFPPLIPGIGLEILGAMQQAPQPARQGIVAMGSAGLMSEIPPARPQATRATGAHLPAKRETRPTRDATMTETHDRGDINEFIAIVEPGRNRRM